MSSVGTATLSEANQSKPAASIWARIQAGEVVSAKDKKAAFVTDCARLAEENLKIQARLCDGASLRLATYNVHLFATPDFKWPKTISPQLLAICAREGVDVQLRKVTSVFDTIYEIDADVLVLQEAASDSLEEFEDYKKIFRALGYSYGLDVFGNMNTDPDSKYGPFGNWILSKYPLVQAPQVTHFKSQYTGPLKYKEDDVSRCFINAKCTLPSGQVCSVYTTHLDVFDDSEHVRLSQIKELVEVMEGDPSDTIILAGDLNSVRPEDYTPENWHLIMQDNAARQNAFTEKLLPEKTPTLVLNYLKEHGFVDCFSKKGVQGPQFTEWTGTAIDFLFVKEKPAALSVAGCGVFYSGASDHIPVVMDLKV